jgi:hypothetical protein
VRWFDGASWTHHLASAGAPQVDPGAMVAATDATGVWLRRLLFVLPVAQVLSFALIFGGLRRTFHEIATSIDSGSSTPVTPVRGGWSGLGQLLGLASTAALVLRMVWMYRATAAARALGLVTRREPGLACAGWLIPIVNFWWPYQSMLDLFPPDRRPRARILRWWLVFLLGSLATTTALVVTMVIAGWTDGSAVPSVVAGAIALGVYALWASLEAALVAQVGELHRDLLRSRLRSDRVSYP